ncbi:hypothetical protein K435DRAFT_875877 [Dendrothele bispora CBS 962.96]|uniref:Ribonuclease H1 N-terminal domain-containing protein n=1 Tax=Dendrothele bispora (strain CBS 962.96) TaxID=1314807 RepID=A0A4S8KTD9_DENBC|nr:hypothetical protein K435DRAFT_875877 [Dendrothele bispora CBS 962.96]
MVGISPLSLSLYHLVSNAALIFRASIHKKKPKGKGKQKVGPGRGPVDTQQTTDGNRKRIRKEQSKGDTVKQMKGLSLGENDDQSDSGMRTSDFFDSDSADSSGPECVSCPCTPAKARILGPTSPPPYSAVAPETPTAAPTPQRTLTGASPASFPEIASLPLQNSPGPSRIRRANGPASPTVGLSPITYSRAHLTGSPGQKNFAKKFSAYAVYKGRSVGVSTRWADVAQIVNSNSGALFKGFPSLQMAQESYDLVKSAGLVSLMALEDSGRSEPTYVVLQGVAPGVYHGR